MNRKITFGPIKKEPPVEKIVLKKLIGLASEHNLLIFEDTITEEWIGVYTTTGAQLKLKGKQLPVTDWGRDLNGFQIMKTVKVYEYIKPPPKKSPMCADDCGCEDCKELNQAIKAVNNLIDDFGQPGD